MKNHVFPEQWRSCPCKSPAGMVWGAGFECLHGQNVVTANREDSQSCPMAVCKRDPERQILLEGNSKRNGNSHVGSMTSWERCYCGPHFVYLLLEHLFYVGLSIQTWRWISFIWLHFFLSFNCIFVEINFPDCFCRERRNYMSQVNKLWQSNLLCHGKLFFHCWKS